MSLIWVPLLGSRDSSCNIDLIIHETLITDWSINIWPSTICPEAIIIAPQLAAQHTCQLVQSSCVVSDYNHFIETVNDFFKLRLLTFFHLLPLPVKPAKCVTWKCSGEIKEGSLCGTSIRICYWHNIPSQWRT